MQPRHDCPDRDVEDLRRVGIREVPDVDEHDHVTEVVRYFGECFDHVVLRETLDDAVLVGRTVRGLFEPVVEEVVPFLERLRIWLPLDPTPAIDVQVREDAKQPGTKIRSGRERAPRTKRARVSLLHQVVGLLAGTHEMARDSINLIRQCKSVLLEAHAVACSRCQPPSLRLPSRLAHSGHPSKALTALTTRRFSSFRVPDLHDNRAARSRRGAREDS